MSFGKLYGFKENMRTTSLLVIAKENNLDIDLVETRPGSDKSDDYKKLNALGKIPTFVGSNGTVITQCMAIAIFFASQKANTTLLGKTKQDYAHIIQWMSYANTDFASTAADVIQPMLGRTQYNKKAFDAALNKLNVVAKVIEDHLLLHTFLVGETITLADLFCASVFNRAASTALDKKWRAEHPHTTRWLETIVNQAAWKAVMPQITFVDEAKPPAPAASQKAPPKKKETPKAKPKDDDDDDDEPAAAEPKAKHPLEALPKASIAIDEWKRKYKNTETREEALPWFWEKMNFEEYSIWRVDYKYNDELTLTFMSANLIGGLFARLEASRKYIMGCASVYGQNNDSIIEGAFLVRGQEAAPAFDVAPDWESYEFTKLEPKSKADREFVEDQWAWDKPIEVKGKTYEWADGKIFV